MRLLFLSMACLFSSQLFAQTLSPQVFMEGYLTNALSLYGPQEKAAFTDPKKARARISQAFKLQRMWVKAKNPPLDGSFLHENSGRPCSVQGGQPAGAYIQVDVHCSSVGQGSNSGNGYYLLRKKRKGWKIKAFSTNPANLQVATTLAKTRSKKWKRANPSAQKIGSATPNEQVEVFMKAVMEKLPPPGKGGAGNMALLNPVVKATAGLWADDREARRGQARTISYFLMFSPESYKIESAAVKGSKGTVGISFATGNSSWKKIGGKASKTGNFKLIQVGSKWFLLDFEGGMS